jgi:N,N'-diacetyllegionaminate synthase
VTERGPVWASLDGGCWIIAEAGVNHNGDPKLARQLVDSAAAAGADAVKFQTFDPQLLASPAAQKASYQRSGDEDSESQQTMLESLRLPASAYPALIARCADRGVHFLSTPFDEASADMLLELGSSTLKISSGDLTNHGLLEHAARRAAGLILSTGMSTMEEVAAAVGVIRDTGNARLALLHCVSAYPAPAEQSNLRAMAAMRERFGTAVGWSDHTEGIAVAIGAAVLGAEIIEKHLTLDRTLPGPDHRASLEPVEFRAMVDGIRAVGAALGDGVKRPVPAESDVVPVARKSLHARRPLAAGSRIRNVDLIALRPGSGISPARLVELVGRELRREVRAGQMIEEADFV